MIEVELVGSQVRVQESARAADHFPIVIFHIFDFL